MNTCYYKSLCVHYLRTISKDLWPWTAFLSKTQQLQMTVWLFQTPRVRREDLGKEKSNSLKSHAGGCCFVLTSQRELSSTEKKLFSAAASSVVQVTDVCIIKMITICAAKKWSDMEMRPVNAPRAPYCVSNAARFTKNY